MVPSMSPPQPRSSRPRRRTIDASLSLASAGLSAGVLNVFYPATWSGVTVATVAVHEMGHKVAANKAGIEDARFVVLPLGPIVVGVTKAPGLKDLDPQTSFDVSIAGMISGIVFSVTCILPLTIFLGQSLLGVMTAVALSQLVSGTLGSDGKRARRLMKEEHAIPRQSQGTR